MRRTHVQIKRFGPLQKVELDLHLKFNVTVGVNRAGKTTILTAISSIAHAGAHL